MKRPVLIIGLILIPVLLIAAGYYYNIEMLSSAGYVILIFYVIMAFRVKFSVKKNK
jgi:hypothetical protein